MCRSLCLLLAATLVGGCVHAPERVSLPVHHAWYEGRDVRYITTDVSHADMALEMGANHAPRLLDGVPPTPRHPGTRTVLERVYAFPGGEQPRNVFASIPGPVGPGSTDPRYSPLWRMVVVAWRDPARARPLRSEAEILDAEADGRVRIAVTDVVVNCPVIAVDDGPTLPEIAARAQQGVGAR